MAVNLTLGAISKISTGKCRQNDLKPVLQVTHIDCNQTRNIDNKKWYLVWLSDGSCFQYGLIAHDIFNSSKLQKGAIIQLTMFQLYKSIIISYIRVCDLNLLHSKCDIIGDPKRYVLNKTPLVVTTTTTIPDLDHSNSHHVEESPTSKQKQVHFIAIDDVEEPPTFIRNPSTSTQRCSSHSPTQSKKRKLQSKDDAISVFGKDISNMKMMVDLTNDIRVLHKKLETLEEVVYEMKKMMMEKNKDDDMGACIEKLDKMGWGAQEPMYDTALLLFGQSADYRKLWLHLKPESCGKWVKNAGSMFGLLD